MAVEIERKYLVDTVYVRRFLGNTSPPDPKMIQCLPWLVGEFGDV